MKTLIYLFFISLIQLTFSQQVDITCKDPKGNHVDWWVMIKLPKAVGSGKQFMYYDEFSSKFTKFEDLNDPNSPLIRTIAPIQNLNSQDNFAAFWNDSHFDDEEYLFDYAHSKGMLGGGEQNGFILNHSAPKFPHFTQDDMELEVYESQQKYGQHFFCMSVSIETINQYAQVFQLNKPYMYKQSYVPEKFQDKMHNLVDLIRGKYRNGTFEKFEFKSLGRQNFTMFAKSGEWEVPFYYDVVAQSYDLSLFVENWGTQMDAICDKGLNVQSNLQVTFDKNISYPQSQDHCKYLISQTEDLVCFGDINRSESQYKRGGGTNCFNLPTLHQEISKTFTSQQKCPNQKKNSFLRKFLEKYTTE